MTGTKAARMVGFHWGDNQSKLNISLQTKVGAQKHS